MSDGVSPVTLAIGLQPVNVAKTTQAEMKDVKNLFLIAIMNDVLRSDQGT